MPREIVGRLKLAAAIPVRAHEIRIAEGALRRRPVLLAARPEIAAREAQEHGPAPRLHALALKGQETFLHSIGHA